MEMTDLNEVTNTIAQDAAIEYRARQERRHHPVGKFDNAKRWYPDESEYRSCCGPVRSPSRAWPMSYMVHCRTLKHVASLYGVTPTEVRKALKNL